MVKDRVEKLLSFLRVVDHFHFGIYYRDGVTEDFKWIKWIEFKNGPDAVLSPSTGDGEKVAQIVRDLFSTADLSEQQRKVLSKPLSPVIVPVEPFEYDGPGITLLKNGIGKIARPEIVHLFWEAFSILKEKQDYHYVSNTEFARDMRLLLQGLSESDPRIALILGRMDQIPADYLELPFFEPLHSTTFAQTGKTYEKIYEPHIRRIALEQCNRACSHCGALSTPRRSHLKFEDFLRCVDMIPFSPEVSISYGEPFYWSDNHDDNLVALGDLVEIIAGPRFNRRVEIVTSGINFEAGVERKAAEKIAGLPKEAREKVKIMLTVSDYPNFRLKSLRGVEAARKVQQDTLKFVAEAGLPVGFLSFIPSQQAKAEIIVPTVTSLFPAFPKDQIVLAQEVDIEDRCEAPIGRAALKTGEYNPPETFTPHRGCVSCYGLRTYKDLDLFDRRDVFKPNAEGLYVQDGELTLTGDGALVPGCCTFIASYAEIANLKTDSMGEIRQKTTEFIRRLDKLRKDEKLNCISCIASANKIRRPRLLRKSHGDAAADLCLRKTSK